MASLLRAGDGRPANQASHLWLGWGPPSGRPLRGPERVESQQPCLSLSGDRHSGGPAILLLLLPREPLGPTRKATTAGLARTPPAPPTKMAGFLLLPWRPPSLAPALEGRNQAPPLFVRRRRRRRGRRRRGAPASPSAAVDDSFVRVHVCARARASDGVALAGDAGPANQRASRLRAGFHFGMLIQRAGQWRAGQGAWPRRVFVFF